MNDKPTSAVDTDVVPKKEEINNGANTNNTKPQTGTTSLINQAANSLNTLNKLITKPQSSKPEFTIEESDEALSGPSPVIKDDDENKERKRRQH